MYMVCALCYHIIGFKLKKKIKNYILQAFAIYYPHEN